MRVHCTNCGRDGHAKWQCTRPTKSTAARKDVQVSKRIGQTGGNASGAIQSKASTHSALTCLSASPNALAGTQALPVDTNNPSSPKGSGVESLRTPTEGRKGRDSTSGGGRAKLRDPSAVLTQTAAKPPVGTNSRSRLLKGSSGMGLASPAKVRDAETANTKDASKFDKVAYMAKYMARYRAEIKAGKRVPKRKGNGE